MGDIKDELWKAKAKLKKLNQVRLDLPNKFAFKDHGVFEFESTLNFFNWNLENRQVIINLTTCKAANYQALSLLVAYAWKLRNQGCTVSFIESESEEGPSQMWKLMGARGLFQVAVHPTMNFKGNPYKPLIAIRNIEDFKKALSSADTYTSPFTIEYTNTLRYVLSELLYNTLEHGVSYFNHNNQTKRVPSHIQFTWYQNSNELHFIVVDTGIGIKKHIEQAYAGQDSDESAIMLAIKPQVSGTFGNTDPYKEKNNAGVGLFISSNIIRRLNAEMHIVSGNGLVHISPRDITGKTLASNWPGTFVLVTLKLEEDATFSLHSMMQEFREKAMKEQHEHDDVEEAEVLYVLITNHFGSLAEDKEAAIRFRNSRLIPAINENKNLKIDFNEVTHCPHSFLSALLATPIKKLGMTAYKKIKILNATPEIRETIDFILDENTEDY